MIDNTEKVLDSRDIIARIDDLQEIKAAVEAAQEEVDEAQEELDTDHADVGDKNADVLAALKRQVDTAQIALTAAKDDYEDVKDELEQLEALAQEGEQYSEDWEDGATLIREDYFTPYCKEMLDDCGDLPKDLPSYIVINWEETSDNLKADYTGIEFDGATYYLR